MSENKQLVKSSAREQGVANLGERYSSSQSSYYGESPTEQGGFSRLHDYWYSVRKHLWLIMGIVALVTMFAAIYMARQPDVFESKARVQVDLEINNPALGAIKSNSTILNMPSQDPTYFNTQLQILSSSALLSRVIKTLDLEHNQAFLLPQSRQSRTTWQSLQHMVGIDKKDDEKAGSGNPVSFEGQLAPPTARDDQAEINRLAPLVESLQSRLSVKQLNETRLIEIRFSHPDPQVAAKIVNAVADAFVLSNLERKTETSNTTGDFLQKRVAELQSEIRNGEERLINYAKEHQILSLDASQNTVVDRLTGLNKQLLEAENDRKMAEAAYKASLAPGAAEAMVEANEKSAKDTEAKLTDLRQKRAQLLVEYTEKYPEVKELDEQIALLEKQRKEVSERAKDVVTKNLETRYAQALQREKALRAAFEEQRGETLSQNAAAVNYRIIQQEVETNKTLLDGLLQRSKENDVVMAGTPNNIHVIDYSPIPKVPVGPRRLQGVALGAIFSLLFGIALARYMDYLDDTLHTAADVEKTLHLPALAVIPAIGSLKRLRLLPSVTSLQKRGANDNQDQLLLKKDSRSTLAEAYRQLRTSILLSSAGGAPQTLLVTSSQPAEGKTTTAINTAITLAQTGAQVIVIDADLRRPRVHMILDKQNERGLSTILSNRMSEAEMLSLIDQDENTGLYSLISGPIPPNPAELLGSEQMKRLLEALRPTFTHIIIDSPPVVSFTDAVLLSTMVDGVLLVVHGGKATHALVRRSRQILQDVGAKVFGVVLNNVNLNHQDDYYKYYYQSHYYNQESSSASQYSGTGTDY